MKVKSVLDALALYGIKCYKSWTVWGAEGVFVNPTVRRVRFYGFDEPGADVANSELIVHRQNGSSFACHTIVSFLFEVASRFREEECNGTRYAIRLVPGLRGWTDLVVARHDAVGVTARSYQGPGRLRWGWRIGSGSVRSRHSWIGVRRGKGNDMGYSIYIGNAVVTAEPENYEGDEHTDCQRWANWLAALSPGANVALAGLLLDEAPSEVLADWYSEHGAPETVLAYRDLDVRSVNLSEAPAFPGDEMSHHNNGRHPSYSGWANFLDDVGLSAMFFNGTDGLMREHPGTFLLEQRHLRAVRNTVARYHRQWPNVAPSFGDDMTSANLGRLLWLEWWMAWALENCPVPAIYNH